MGMQLDKFLIFMQGFFITCIKMLKNLHEGQNYADEWYKFKP